MPVANDPVVVDPADAENDQYEDSIVPENLQGYGPWRLHTKVNNLCIQVSTVSQ